MPDHPIPSDKVPPGQIVTAASYLIDRICPDCEVIALPERSVQKGTVGWQVGQVSAVPKKKKNGIRKLIAGPATQRAPEGRWIIDFRRYDPDNWAHFLNNHLPLLFFASAETGLPLSDALVILPGNTPGYITTVAGLFGVETLTTDDVIEGHGVTIDVRPWTALRSIRAQWVRLPAPRAAIELVMADPPGQDLPRKVFLSRRDTRTISNATEIDDLLTARGFGKIYPETLSVADQIRLFRNAEEIVAVHGAGLAPLLYCEPGHGPRRLVEILPCGHMTDVYRVMSAQVGCDWIGVRGRIKPEYVRPAYKIGTAFLDYSLDAFEVDPGSLEKAFDLLDERAGG